jgi:hypothetical protein
MKRQRTFFFFFDLMMIGQQKIEAVPERSRLPTRASRCFLRSQLSDPGGDTAKSYQQLEKASSGVSSRYC